jgi:transposase-like protein
MSGGRPKISDETWAQVAELYERGYSDQSIARQAGICSFSVYNWRHKQKVKSNWTKAGFKHRAEFGNFEQSFDYNAHLQEWFKEVGATSAEEKRYCLQVAAKEMIRLREGGLA